jgi:glycosyltransferase involved in cell wall biosynthesis
VELRELAKSLGLSLGKDVIPLGYLDDTSYFTLLLKAWALVMPTLAEGFSFPVWEALHCGIPVVASDIPVLREQASFLAADLSWFDPHDPTSIASCLEDLRQKYDCRKASSVEKMRNLRRRSWVDVAEEYFRIFRCKGDRAGIRDSGSQDGG